MQIIESYEAGDNLTLDEYFDYHAKKLDEDLQNGKAQHVFITDNSDNKEKQKMKIPYHLFGDENFQSMIDQVNSKQLAGYEFLASSPIIQITKRNR